MSDPMTRRVSCKRCKSHRDLTRSLRCLVCGADVYDDVKPTVGDLDADAGDDPITELLAAVVALDRALTNGHTITMWNRHALRLSVAYRRLMVARH